MQLRGILNDLANRVPKPKKLHADKTARETVIEVAYVEYARLSLDAVHCSLTALGRHITKESVAPDRTDITINVEARIPAAERLATLLHLCCALTGAAITANELLGFTSVSGMLAAMVEEFENNGWVKAA